MISYGSPWERYAGEGHRAAQYEEGMLLAQRDTTHHLSMRKCCICRVGCVCAYLEDVASTLDLLFVAVDAQLLHVAAQRLRLRMRGALLCTTNTGGGRARHARSATTRGAGASARPPARNVARRLRY